MDSATTTTATLVAAPVLEALALVVMDQAAMAELLVLALLAKIFVKSTIKWIN